MAPKASSTKPTKRGASAPETVEGFLASLDHPFKQEILAIRQVILGADPAIAEGIKWNAPSFRTSEHNGGSARWSSRRESPDHRGTRELPERVFPHPSRRGVR